MKKTVSVKKYAVCAFALSLLLLTQPLNAVNFFDGARAPKAFYFLTYTSFYAADKTTNNAGGIKRSDYGYTKAEEMLRLSYYTPNFTLCLFAPFGRAHADYYNQTSGGLGDINIGGGGFLPFSSIDILPMIFVKIPTGEYSADKAVNYGANQTDIKPSVFIYKSWGKLSLDAAAKYFIRLENPATDVRSGNELYLQALPGWQAADRLKIGLSFNWMRSQKQQKNGKTVQDSARESLAIGPELYYRFPGISVTVTWLYDAISKNLTKGNFFQLKTCSRF